ncbi:MAG TPA: YraN family protein [Steroidobacteraceae bacterium]|nr:YraN family protein [Steroidobacteraceae bacterium]
MDRRRLGAEAETAARDFLVARGLSPLLANYRCRFGELDLVLREGSALVVVEVRRRSSTRFGGARASIDARKRRRIALATHHLLLTHPGLRSLPIRFDVVAIDAAAPTPGIEWIRAAFTSET